MTSKARIVWGTLIEWGTDGASYEAISEMSGLGVPEESPEFIDVTHNASPGRRKEYVPGFIEGGELTISGNNTPAVFAAAYGYMTAGTLVHFRTTLPVYDGQATGDQFVFKGYVTPKLTGSDAAAKIDLEISVRTTGEITHTAGTAA